MFRLLNEWKFFAFRVEADDTGGGGGSTGTNDGQPAPDESGDKAFNQSDIDKAAAKARREGKQSALNDFLGELGFEKPDDLKSLLAQWKQKQEAEKTEAEKAADLAAQERQKRELLEKELSQMREAQKQERLSQAVAEAVKTAHARKPQDVVDLMRVRGKLDGLLTEEGMPDTKAITAMVEAFKKDNAEYFSTQAPGSPSFTGGTPPNPDQKALDEARQTMQKHTRRF